MFSASESGTISRTAGINEAFITQHQEVALLCPVQGSPVPQFRYTLIINFVKLSQFHILCRASISSFGANLQQVISILTLLMFYVLVFEVSLFSASESGTISRTTGIRSFEAFISQHQAVSLLCPVQGYPVPKFR